MCQCSFTNYNKCTTLVVLIMEEAMDVWRPKEQRRENERERDGEIEEGRKELPVMSFRF